MNVQGSSWIIMIGFLSVFLLMVVLIGLLLFSLAKQGDERKKFIKTKAIVQTLAIMVGVLFIDVLFSVYRVFAYEGKAEGINPFLFLVTISIVFFISLMMNKKRYGD